MFKNKLLMFILLFFVLFNINPVVANAMIDPNATITDFPEKYEGVFLLVNKTKNYLFVYLNGNVVYTFRIATGKNNSLTPEGTYRIITKVKEPWYLPKNIPGGDKNNPLGTRWLGLSVPETGGYKYGIHGTNNPYSIGSHVSLGCIRMHNRDVEWLYRHIPLNTPVIIKN